MQARALARALNFAFLVIIGLLIISSMPPSHITSGYIDLSLIEIPTAHRIPQDDRTNQAWCYIVFATSNLDIEIHAPDTIHPADCG